MHKFSLLGSLLFLAACGSPLCEELDRGTCAERIDCRVVAQFGPAGASEEYRALDAPSPSDGGVTRDNTRCVSVFPVACANLSVTSCQARPDCTLVQPECAMCAVPGHCVPCGARCVNAPTM